MTYLETLFSLKGKKAVVTGASRGIGLGIAEALLKAEASVILVSSNEGRLQETTSRLKAQGLKASMIFCDLSQSDQVTALVEQLKQDVDQIDILVNNAGVTFGHNLLSYPDDAWEKTWQVNLDAVFRLSRGIAAMMKDQGQGAIINITSIGAERGFPNNPAYVAAKGALKQLSKAFAYDLGAYGIRVNNIGPGYIKTDMTSQSWQDDQLRAQRTARTMLGRWGEPSDLAGTVILLASDASAYITGQDIYIDGGWLAKGI